MKVLQYAAFACFAALCSCANNKTEEPKPEPVVACTPGANGFAAKVNPIIQAKCSTPTCHASGGTGNGWFNSYENLKEKIDNGSFKRRVFDLKDMPPLGHPALTADELKSLRCWYDNGAQNN